MNTPLISVIIPCYNQAQYLDECLQSVFDQTYENWECIIVNDGSADSTEEIAQRWSDIDSRFKYVYKKNGGLSSARNAGIESAIGEWILPLDADDLIASHYLEYSVAEINRGFNLIYFKMRLFGQVNREYHTALFDYDELLYSNPFYCSCVFPKEKWTYVGGYDENLIYGKEDWEFWINMVYNTPTKVIRLDYVGFWYRKKETSMLTALQGDSEKSNFSVAYIIQKHAAHYAKSHKYVQDTIKQYKEYKKLTERYRKFISENLFVKVANKLRKALRIRIK